MKVRESGMPEEDYWNTFFDVEEVIQKLIGDDPCENGIVEFGSGYGTFTYPIARHVKGTLHAFDIEPDLIEKLSARAKQEGLSNINPCFRDFVTDGTGLDSDSVSHVMIYNLLHIENPVGLLKEAHRILKFGGRISIMHWRSDIETPRGPSLEIRPNAEQSTAWMTKAGFTKVMEVDISEGCEYHFGAVGVRQ